MTQHAMAGQSTVGILAIVGTAGVGKTTLAIRWAHEAAAQFPDGQLYLDLLGFAPAEAGMPPGQAIRIMLDSLGVARERIPAATEAQATMYRSLLAGRRMLIVLDNARDPGQVRPLLPGGSGCLVLVTSRSDLAGLAATDGARLLPLGLLTDAQGRQLLASHLGDSTVAADPAAVTELITLCAGLPLALSIAAARAATAPELALAALVARLRDSRTRLDGLSTGEAATDLRAVLSWSLQQLTEPAARMFRLLGLHPGPDVTAAAAASLAGIPLARADQILSELVRANLLTEHLPGRYACHDLLRGYASEQALAQNSDPVHGAALRRAFDYYLHAACTASRAQWPDRAQITVAAPLAAVVAEDFADCQQALDWFGAERLVLVAAISCAAADEELSSYASQLAWAVSPFLWWHGYWPELEAVQNHALAVMRRLGDRAFEVPALRLLALAKLRLGDLAGANDCLSEALAAAAQPGGELQQALVHTDVAALLDDQGRHHEAIGHVEEALRLQVAAAHWSGQVASLSNLGWFHARDGRYERSIEYCEQALALLQELGAFSRPRLEAGILHNLGYVRHRLGRYADAIALYRRALELDGEAGDLRFPAEVFTHLGDSHHAAGDYCAARQAWQQAMELLNQLDPAACELRGRLAHGKAADGVGIRRS